jgi:SAM-dependent methyltransferase
LSAPEANRPFDPAWYEELSAREDENFWFRARAALIVRHLRSACPGMRSFAEFGCGTGHVLAAVHRAFPAAELTATEFFEEGLQAARRRVPSARFLRVDLEEAGLDSPVDAVGAFDVLEHIRDDAAAARSLAASVRRGGSVLVTVPQHPGLWSWQDECSMHQRRYRSSGISALLSEAGLRVEREVSFVSLLLPLMVASRKARVGPPPDPMAEFRISGWTNGLLHAVMQVEDALRRCGVRYPAGGSLLVVARRP